MQIKSGIVIAPDFVIQLVIQNPNSDLKPDSDIPKSKQENAQLKHRTHDKLRILHENPLKVIQDF